MEFYNAKDMCMPAKVYFALALVAVIMTSITSFDFSNIDELIKIGRSAAEKHKKEIIRLVRDE